MSQPTYNQDNFLENACEHCGGTGIVRMPIYDGNNAIVDDKEKPCPECSLEDNYPEV